MLTVDAHHHLWGKPPACARLDDDRMRSVRRPFTVAQWQAQLRAAEVDRSILVESGRCDEAESEDLLRWATEAPQIAGVVLWADLTGPGLEARIARHLRRAGGDRVVGVRAQIQAEPDPDHLDRPDVRRGLRVVAAAGLAFDLLVRVDQLPAAARAAAALPHVRFVLDHLGKPEIRAGATGLARWRGAFAALAEQPNVTAKLSGLVTEADWVSWRADDLRPFVREALDRFGPDRLMFGSDWPLCLLAGSYGRVRAALHQVLPALSEAALHAIFGGTAGRVYRLGV
ncbi:amidohydrolase family protein [Micromonospora zamorensis]|uniref:amidohydrolase family protein n=1 Tax=Micromonospora zamorensis TaxID=709883 RepID=UPI002ED14E30|nr:amidohydrolase family protein [Micromonospora zamorensis]